MVEIPLCNVPPDEDSQKKTDPQVLASFNYPPNLGDLRNVLSANACLQQAVIRRAKEAATRNGLIAV